MKKIMIVILAAAFVMAPVFAAGPTEDEVGEALGGVMIVYAIVAMGSMFGGSFDGAELTMDMETGESSLDCDNLDVESLMSSDMGMGMMSSMSEDGDSLDILFTRMSGTISASGEGNLNLDVTLKGGPVKNLVLVMEDEEAVTFKANGKDYRYLANSPDFMDNLGE